MNKIFLFVFLFTLSFTYSQSKSETEKWITEKYSEYKCSDDQKNDLWFENSYLYYYWDNPWEEGKGHLYRIRLKDIKAVKTSLKKLDYIYVSKLTLYYKSGAVSGKDIPNDSNFSVSEGSFYDIFFDHNFIKEGANLRMEKAILHLVKLNGGNASIKKEAF